jgi:hypothetical protein
MHIHHFKKSDRVFCFVPVGAKLSSSVRGSRLSQISDPDFLTSKVVVADDGL